MYMCKSTASLEYILKNYMSPDGCSKQDRPKRIYKFKIRPKHGSYLAIQEKKCNRVIATLKTGFGKKNKTPRKVFKVKLECISCGLLGHTNIFCPIFPPTLKSLEQNKQINLYMCSKYNKTNTTCFRKGLTWYQLLTMSHLSTIQE